jgi:hypothetical protein
MLHQARIICKQCALYVTLPEKPTAAGSTPRTHERRLQANVCGKMIANTVCKRCALGVTLPLE